MDCYVDMTVDQSLVYLFGEKPFTTNVSKRLGENLVTGGFDDLDVDGSVFSEFRVYCLELGSCLVCLSKC